MGMSLGYRYKIVDSSRTAAIGRSPEEKETAQCTTYIVHRHGKRKNGSKSKYESETRRSKK